jgi:ABC-type multidrug transport system ATPase subunit
MDEQTAIEVRGLTRTYGKRAAVSQLDVTVQLGDVYGFLGPNGAGKTTALRCIAGLIRPDAGSVRILAESDNEQARRHLGAIIEAPTFHTWLSGRENLMQAAAYSGISGKTAGAEIDRVLERVGLTERGKDKAGGYSMGMKQRLGIARALLGRPKILLLDEPTNGLDPRGMHEMRELVRSLALHDRITVVLCSHLLAEVQAVCNRVGILQEGRLRAEGSVTDLLAAGAVASLAEVGAADRDALDRALEAMDGVEVVGAGSEGRVRVLHRGFDLPSLNRALVERGVPVDALVPVRRDLEEVFLEVTK